MLSSSIALICLYTCNRYRAFGNRYREKSGRGFSRFHLCGISFRLARALHPGAVLEKCLSSSAFALLDTRKSLKPLRRGDVKYCKL